MQFGLFMMPLHPPERSFTESYDRDLARIVLADWLGYHHLARGRFYWGIGGGAIPTDGAWWKPGRQQRACGRPGPQINADKRG